MSVGTENVSASFLNTVPNRVLYQPANKTTYGDPCCFRNETYLITSLSRTFWSFAFMEVRLWNLRPPSHQLCLNVGFSWCLHSTTFTHVWTHSILVAILRHIRVFSLFRLVNWNLENFSNFHRMSQIMKSRDRTWAHVFDLHYGLLPCTYHKMPGAFKYYSNIGM